MVRSQITKANGEPVKVDYMMRRSGETRDVGDSEHAEIVIADRTYRVRLGDLA
jgi:hypothetical protein